MKKDEKSISATVILNQRNSDGFLEYPYDLAKIIDILNENPHD